MIFGYEIVGGAKLTRRRRALHAALCATLASVLVGTLIYVEDPLRTAADLMPTDDARNELGLAIIAVVIGAMLIKYIAEYATTALLGRDYGDVPDLKRVRPDSVAGAAP